MMFRTTLIRIGLLEAIIAIFVAVSQQPLASLADLPHGQNNSADRLIFWVGYQQVLKLTDEQLDLWKSRGVDGFICSTRHLFGMGGKNGWTADPEADLNENRYAAQRAFQDTQVVARARDRDMKMYLGVYLVNANNPATPLKDWFDDDGWREVVIPSIRDFAAAAKRLGFAGIAFDQELYPQKGGVSTATWSWKYPGNKHSEREVRAKARQRGQEVMAAIVEAFPDVELVIYHYKLPGTWEDVVEKQINNVENSSEPMLFIDWIDGLTSVDGYRAIRLINAVFYKGPHVGNWDAALQYEYNTLFSMFSQRLSNWPHASGRVIESPFIWINAGPRPGWESARSPEFVASQLSACNKWGMGGEFCNYVFGSLERFDYTPYVAAMQSASTPEIVDSTPPDLQLTSPTDRSTYECAEDSLDLAGFATDDFAIRVVRWQNDRGGSGTAKLHWKVHSGTYRTNWDWQMDWSIAEIPLQLDKNTITIVAEDIKGLTTSQILTVTRRP